MKFAWYPEELAAAKPPERLTISQWACKYRELGKLSAITGLYSLEMTPYWGPIMDRCCSPDIDQVVVVGPAQSGKTVAIVENVTGYYLHQDPSSIMIVLADEDTAYFISEEKIAPMFKDSAALSYLYDKKTFNKGEIGTHNGGHVDLAWASSVAKLATKPERIVICDEVDKPGYGKQSKEAGAISLARERTVSYPDGYFKHIFTSTPTTPEGNIMTLLEQSDVIYDWHVPCPYCGQFQPLRWSSEYCHGFTDGKYRGDDGELHQIGGVVWDGGRKATLDQIQETARYRCGECGQLWDTWQKNKAVQAGKEVPRTEATGKERKTGHHVNRIYSLFDSGKLEKLVSEWVSIWKLFGAQHVRSLQGFINSTLAEPFKRVVRQKADSVEKILSARCDLPPQLVPTEAVALVCYVDVQKHGFWFVVRAFAADYRSWNIHHGYLTSWEDVETLLFVTQYPVDGDGEKFFRIGRAAVDTGGTEKWEDMSMTEETYFWLRKNGTGRGCRVFGTKGSNTPLPSILQVMKPMDSTPSGKSLQGGLQLIRLDTQKLKDKFIYRLNQAIDGESYHAAYLHKNTDDEYAKHILAEEKQTDPQGNEMWVKISARNDLFDCECGCLALAEPEWPGGGVNLFAKKQPGRESKASESKPNQNALPKKKDWFKR
jgi:phage terminase large subunit GpA-like protein